MSEPYCPHCGSPKTDRLSAYWTCKADTTQRDEDGRTHLCRAREKSRQLQDKLTIIKAIAERAVAAMTIMAYGEETFDFEWAHMRKQAAELHKELEDAL